MLPTWTRIIVATGFLLAGLISPAFAQRGGFGGGPPSGGFGGGGPPSPDGFFNMVDRNQDGQIDSQELSQGPGFMRDMLSRNGIDTSRPISRDQFSETMQRAREQRERDGGGFGSFSGGSRGGPPSDDRGREGDSRSGGDNRSGGDSRSSNSGDRRDERSDDRRGDSSSSSKSKKKKPKEKITQDLPEDYRDRDKDGDGQIGLYEWDRKAFAQFLLMDMNGDGLLTPNELLVASKKGTTGTSSSTNTVAATGSRSGGSSQNNSSGRSGDSNSSRGSSSSGNSRSGDSKSSGSGSSTSSASPAALQAFQFLDRDRDGTLTTEEWERSRNTRQKFESAGITVSLPMKQSQFVELFKKTEGS